MLIVLYYTNLYSTPEVAIQSHWHNLSHDSLKVDKYCPNHYTMLLSHNTVQSALLNTPDIQPHCCKTAVSMHKLTTIPDDTHPLVAVKTEFRAPEYRIIQHEPTFMPYCN